MMPPVWRWGHALPYVESERSGTHRPSQSASQNASS